MRNLTSTLASACSSLVFGLAACAGTSPSSTNAGGATSSGGSAARGGASNVGGNVEIGGSPSTGGTTGMGGIRATGGSATAGGTPGNGGVAVIGGALSTGGAAGKGGTSPTGGAVVAGGTSPTGGKATNGGSATTGGATSVAGNSGFGNPNGHCTIPAAALPESIANPTTVITDCTSAGVVAAVAKGGIITFNCGPNPVTIAMAATANIYNKVNNVNNDKVVIDGGGLVTLDGGGARRILYQNTCDQNLIWATSTCNAQSFPKLTLQNITFANGLGQSSEVATGGLNGGGAVFVTGGTFKSYNVKFAGSKETHVATELAQDLAGGALYLFELTAPAYIVNSTFQNNSATNGGALGSLFVSSVIINSLFSGNSATGHGMNPAASGTTGGGLGGAIYNDGNDYALNICGTAFTNNTANELGTGAIFQVVNNLNGDLSIDQSTFVGNTTNGSVQSGHPSIYVEARDKAGNAGVTITNTAFN